MSAGWIESAAGQQNQRCEAARIGVPVAGDPRLIDDARVAAIAGPSGRLVTEFRYRDRMAGIPIHDEQGTRYRPHDLLP